MKLHKAFHISLLVYITSQFSSVESNQLTVYKLEDLKNNTNHTNLTVLISNFAPFAWYNKHANRFDGIEVELVNTIAEHLKVVPVFVSADNINIDWKNQK